MWEGSYPKFRSDAAWRPRSWTFQWNGNGPGIIADVADNAIDSIENSIEAATVNLFSTEDAKDVNNVNEKSNN